MISLTNEQKKIIEILLKKYEGSKTCFGENRVNQSFNCKPNDVYHEYYSDYVCNETIEDVETLRDDIILHENSIRKREKK